MTFALEALRIDSDLGESGASPRLTHLSFGT